MKHTSRMKQFGWNNNCSQIVEYSTLDQKENESFFLIENKNTYDIFRLQKIKSKYILKVNVYQIVIVNK